MVSSTLVLPAAAWLMMLLDVTSAALIPVPRQAQESLSTSAPPTTAAPSAAASTPPPSPTAIATPASGLEPWVSVDGSGKPRTVTPVLTTVSGTPTVIDAAPYDVTGTVFTQSRFGAKATVSTGPSQPQATDADGSGAFAVCANKGDFAPFCEPKNGSTLNPGVTHYVTFDPTFFPTNSTVRVIGFYTNATTDSPDEAFSSDLFPAGWGFYQWPIKAELYTKPPHAHPAGVNITLRIAALPAGGGTRTWVPGPTVLVAPHTSPAPTKSPVPTGPALYIGLPTVLGFIVLVLVGTCLWNRHTRRIGVGNVMGRGRGGYGVGKSRRQRILGRGKAKAGDGPAVIRLAEGEAVRGRTMYRDEPSPRVPAAAAAAARDDDDGWGDDSWRREPVVGVPRRDSDALGSLAGSPTKETFGAQPGGGNVFREELDRQQDSRDFRAEQQRRKY